MFPDIRAGTTGYRSDTFSKWFARFLKSVDADGDRTSFHSFRHNFRDALREADVRHEIAMLLGGWSDSSRGKSVQMFYGKGFNMTTIRDEMTKIEFEFYAKIKSKQTQQPKAQQTPKDHLDTNKGIEG